MAPGLSHPDLAGSVGAMEGVNITDKSFRLHKSLRGNSGAKILCENKFGGLGSRAIGYQHGPHI